MAAVSDRYAVDLDTLLSKMTLAEKLGQLNAPLPGFAVAGTGAPTGVPGTDDEIEAFVLGSFHPSLGPGCGFYGLSYQREDGPRAQAELHNALQATARRTGHAIPLLQIAEGCHGVLLPRHTVFPEGLALGSSWDVELFERVYATVAREARAVGVHMLSTLVVEPYRDPRLGRNCEAYTEDPFLLSCLTAALVHGAQGDDLTAHDRAAAILTCFPGQSEGVSGLERGALEVSERTLREDFLPPWEAGITHHGALGVMATYASVDGDVTHGSERLLTGLLRDELGFEGIVLSEGRGFLSLIYEAIVDDQADAGELAIKAGVDLNITYEQAYLGPLEAKVLDGSVPMELLDRAVRRVLEVKRRLGLFEDPFVDPDRAEEVVNCEDHVALALEAARAGIVLLKNDAATLPLDPTTARIAVIGPNADDPVNQVGEYTMAMVRPDLGPPVVTVLEGIRGHVAAGTEVVHARGCGVLGDDTSGFADAVAAAASADVAIVVVGEQGGYADPANPPSVGEQNDVASLDLTGVQEDLVRAVHATGTPTVVVLVNGRPLSIPWIAENVPAIVEAWLPGEQGGNAVADVLFGQHNPSGRLPVTVPRHVGQLPVYYNQRRAKRHMRETDLSFGKDYVDMSFFPLYDFGYGLSYSSFEYSDLDVRTNGDAADPSVTVAFNVTNVSERSGVETPQVYVRDVLASLAPRWKSLRAFSKVALQPGETRLVSFTLGRSAFEMYDRDMRRVVEPGEFEIHVGRSCADVALTARIDLA